MLRLLTAFTAAITLSSATHAFTVFDSFGSFPDATWGGTGIPNDAVAAAKQIVDGDTTITIALSATERFFNPPVSDNGAAIYTASTGSNFGGPGSTSSTEGALWNFNFYVEVDGGGKTITDYDFDLYYDFDPAGPNAFGDLSGLGRIDIDASVAVSADPTATVIEGSQNLLFPFLETSIPGFLDAPTGVTTFDPDAIGNYQFALVVTSLGFGFPVEAVAMEVNAIPVPAAVWLCGSALIGLGVLRKR